LIPDALDGFVVASDGGTREDIAFRVTFTRSDRTGNQQMRNPARRWSQPGRLASFQPGGGNGRALDDNTFDTAVAILAGSTPGNASVPRPPIRLRAGTGNAGPRAAA
jgi:hypothetical protein